MAAVQREFRDFASFLRVTCGKITLDGLIPVLKGKAKGYTTILKYLAREAKNTALFGKNREDEAAIDQWLEYKVSYFDRCSSEKELNCSLNELNLYICDKVYFVGNYLSLADITIFYGLHNILADMTYQDRESIIHLSRWFNNIQQREDLRQTLSLLNFHKTLLYH